MNKELSNLCKEVKLNLAKENSYQTGIDLLFELRRQLKEIVELIFDKCKTEDFSKMPLSSDKTIAYYLYHMFRIEDITSNTLINNTEQVLFRNNYHFPIITTGNEIRRENLVEFSKQINIDILHNYINDVFNNTNEIIRKIDFSSSKQKVSRRENLLSLNVVSTDEEAFWLVDYWCSKTFSGLFQMPFSRHLIMHLEGCLRIMNKI